MHDDFRSYQSAETEWRYRSAITRLKEDIKNTESLLATQKNKLAYLEAHPPLYEHFNWSA